jgi:hypothetical protein
VNKKKQKNFLCWAMGLSPTQPQAQHKRSFCAAFFKKRPFLYTICSSQISSTLMPPRAASVIGDAFIFPHPI